MKPREIGLSFPARIQHQLAMPILSRSTSIRKKVSNIAEISDFIDWQLTTFGDIRTLRKKSALWKRMSRLMRESGDLWHGMEFGVAFGHASHWWLSNNDQSILATWDGFDRFSGLPRPWRGLPSGTFSAEGETPAIDDGRVSWHIGDIEETIYKMDSNRIASGHRLIYFDLDLYEPSKVAWNWVVPFLKPGDILYFDEAFDADERRLLNETIIPSGAYEFIGATDMNLALQVRSITRT